MNVTQELWCDRNNLLQLAGLQGFHEQCLTKETYNKRSIENNKSKQ
jgi:hypothetical protein